MALQERIPGLGLLSLQLSLIYLVFLPEPLKDSLWSHSGCGQQEFRHKLDSCRSPILLKCKLDVKQEGKVNESSFIDLGTTLRPLPRFPPSTEEG